MNFAIVWLSLIVIVCYFVGSVIGMALAQRHAKRKYGVDGRGKITFL